MKFNYCPNCGKPEIKQKSITKYTCSSCGYEFWNNPKTTVAVIIIKDDLALFSKRAIEPRKGQYDFPGGFLEYNESPFEAAAREIMEETSLKINPDDLQLLEMYSAEYIPGVSVVDLMLVTNKFEGSPKPLEETEALEWKPFEFINSKEFVDYYSGLYEKLTDFLNRSS